MLNIYALVQQALLELEKRNEEVIKKIRINLEKIFKAEAGSENILNKLEPFWGILK